jgi:hypothetical protein
VDLRVDKDCPISYTLWSILHERLNLTILQKEKFTAMGKKKKKSRQLKKETEK